MTFLVDVTQTSTFAGSHLAPQSSLSTANSSSVIALMEGQNHVLELIAQGKPLPEILDTLARLIESQTLETAYCSFLLVDQDGKRLRHGAAPSLPTDYSNLIDGIEIGPEVGSCGTAAYRVASVIVEDISIDPLWAAFRELALSYGLRACWSTPILSCDGQVLATFAMYHPFPYRPVPHDRELLIKATYLARIAIERHLNEAALKQAKNSLEIQVEQRTQELQVAIAQLKEQIQERQGVEAQLRNKAQELEDTLRELNQTQSWMIQNEKMSSLGQLVAGVAHEINNPVNFIYGNLTPAREYIEDLFELIHQYEIHSPQPIPAVKATLEAIEFEFLKRDLPKLLNSMQLGADRIKQIVLSLRTFAHKDEAEHKEVDLHEGLESTLTILEHRLKSQSKRAEIVISKDYDQLPLVQCYAGQMNQVFMNLLVNAIDSIEERMGRGTLSAQPEIQISTQFCNTSKHVSISITDNGMGISPEVRSQLFDPFFTTKTIGKGTGMGLAISYQIVTERHQGTLQCISQPNQGATFIITIPIR